MLHRYRIVRGKRPPDDPLPRGAREDTRKHTRHVLAPPTELVEAFLRDTGSGWSRFRERYLATLEERFASDRSPFDALAERARERDVFLGCNCPTRKQPRVEHCHTVLALQFMAQKYPDLGIVLPG